VDLGFDTNIKSGKTNLDLQFTIQGRVYHTSKLPYDTGADTVTGQGRRVFDAVDQETGDARAIKDYWVEDHPGEQLEHDIVSRIKGKMGGEKFCKYFVDTCGHRKTDPPRAFNSLCKTLDSKTSMPRDYYGPQFLTAAADASKLILTDQRHLPQSTLTKWSTSNPPCPRFRYQVVYGEKGISLFEIPSFVDGFVHIGRAADGT